MKSLLGSSSRWPKSVASVAAANAKYLALGGVRWRTKSKAQRARERDRELERRHPVVSEKALDSRDGRGVLRNNLDSGGEAPVRSSSRRSNPVSKRNYELFELLVNKCLNAVRGEMGEYISNPEQYHSFGVTNQAQLDREFGLFKEHIHKAFVLATEGGKLARMDNPIFWSLRNAFVKSDTKGLMTELEHEFQTFMMRSRFPQAITELHKQLADLRFPYEWYPATRQMERTIHLHVGPTNSGKTYNALKALEGAKSGIYAGPLRLLAHEIWSRFTAKNVPCALVTGEEMRIPQGADRWFHSCTVEMSPLNKQVDVAVIDEIQMIGNDERGWAWTQAVLGIQAKEVHLCGEDRVVGLIQDLCSRIGDKCVVHRYERLNPLQTMDKSLGWNFDKLEKGDAVVSFTRTDLHKMKKGIEEATGRRCAIVYGSLPPETRAAQAALFNDPKNDYDFLVASDAIGMGLNLEIKRVIFAASSKYDGSMHRTLAIPEIKQIGGRAGRYRTANAEITSAKAGDGIVPAEKAAPQAPTPGYVTTLDRDDLEIIQSGFMMEAPPVHTAGIFPPASIIEQFHSYFPPRTPTAFVLSRLRELGRMSPRFHMCTFQTPILIAKTIQAYDLSVADRCVFLSAPVDFRSPGSVLALQAFAKCVAEMGSGHILDFKEIDLEVLDLSEEARHALSRDKEYLNRLESLHKTVTLYLWLSYRYEGVFQSQSVAFKVKELVEARITEFLENLNFVPAAQQARRRQLRRLADRHTQMEEELLGTEEQLQEGLQVEEQDTITEETEESEDPGLNDLVRSALEEVDNTDTSQPQENKVERDENDHHDKNKDRAEGSA
ncbi:putative mitochondrial precursorATP-dependent RNA helicase SUV3 [Podospora australis]|uniref:RNA helicase n=1 Tax=Podospora australis TaxID=1536484 RepID=A0AAN6X575_9PEZI|nr:putative mitochondrial precursorATP-dependent RNA helicase SUV3 [Podospora australis]